MPQPQPERIASLDQFRGYTVAGMVLVNFVGGFAVTPAILKHHHTYCSYADTIMPQFFFAVGFALRLVLLRNAAAHGPAAALRRAALRSGGLILLGFVVYHLDGRFRTWAEMTQAGATNILANAFWRSPFQALTHIGVTGLWILPVVLASPGRRLAFALLSGAAHVALSHAFWYEIVHAKRGIDGGLLGFLTWTIPMIAGTLAHDLVAQRGPSSSLRPLLGWGTATMVVGYALSCLSQGGTLAAPPFFPPTVPVDLWTMSQRAGSLSYLLFGAGFSAVVYALFVRCCDVGQTRVHLFAILGQNALAAYLVHLWVDDFVKPFAPRDAPLAWVLFAFGVFFALTVGFVAFLNRRNFFLRL